MKMNRPNYRIIYEDMLQKQHPDKIKECKELLKKKTWIQKIFWNLTGESFPKSTEIKKNTLKSIVLIMKLIF